MNKLNTTLILVCLLLITSLSLVSSQPPLTTIILDRGVDIIHPETQIIENGVDLEFNFWTYNSSSGETLTNETLNCTLYIINDEGIQFFKFSNLAGSSGLITYGKGAPLCLNCWTSILPAENITIGAYSYQIKCQSEGLNIGGYTTGGFEVTYLGETLDTAKSISYSVIMIISILIFIGLFWIGLALPSGNKTDEFTGYVIAVRNLKYLKYVLLGFSYITLLWISYFSWMITYTYLDFEFLTNIFRFMFTFLAILTLPLFILFVWITISNFVRDSQVRDALRRGLKVK